MRQLSRLKPVVLLVLLFSLLHGVGFDDQYQKITDTKQKKATFVGVMLPKIQHANYKIAQDRHFIQKFFNKKVFLNSSRSRKDVKRLNYLAKKYRIKNVYDEKTYLKRINLIPVSLVLAQGALESAWGQSRFTKVANNIFGQWTYKGKGIIPKNRASGKTHKIKLFNSINESIEAYMLNLNRNKAYQEFRDKREKKTRKQQVFTGLQASDTMEKYSGIGKEYNEILKKMIRKNNFGQFDNHTAQKAL
ncbi:MAG: glucosaminidase domain-containing protein [Campylobacterota bacterium]|nr:glucosaminidase domain-containing protein [Campylobacterota bacterium]